MLDPDFILFAVTEKHSQIEVADQACQTFIYQPGVAGLR